MAYIDRIKDLAKYRSDDLLFALAYKQLMVAVVAGNKMASNPELVAKYGLPQCSHLVDHAARSIEALPNQLGDGIKLDICENPNLTEFTIALAKKLVEQHPNILQLSITPKR